jgi:hypothetical protein
MESPASIDSGSGSSGTSVVRRVGRAGRALLAVPASWLFALAIAAVAAWSSHALTLLRAGGPRLGPAIQAAAWVLLYAALLLVLGAAERVSAKSARRLAWRLGMALLLALMSAELVRLAINHLFRRAVWEWRPYVRLFAPLAIAALWCTALLRGETIALARAIRRREDASLIAALTALLIVAAALVTLGDLAFPFARSESSVFLRLASQVIEPRPFIATTLILFVVLALVFAVTSSATTAALFVAPIYATMVFATLVKLHYMHSAVQPLDLLTLPEFMPLFGEFFGRPAILLSVVGIGLWLVTLFVAWRRMRTRLSLGRRIAIGAVSLVMLVATIGLFLPPERLPAPLSSHGDELEAIALDIGAPEGPFREMARSNGIVLTFLSELRTAFVTAPPDYSAERVRSVAARYAPSGAAPVAAKPAGGVSLVLYLVESLMDPSDLGVRFTLEPMPNIRRLAAEQVHGRAIVPREYGGSGNTEFSLLTGMTHAFLPTGSIPYRQYVRRPLPALPRVLHDRGYATTSVQADPRYYYDRERVYPLLGFDRSLWLHDEPVRQRAPRGYWPSDASIVDAVIDASEGPRPFFVFAFPSSTHSPYDEGTYAQSDLRVLDAPTRAAEAELQEYVNAVRTADSAIGRMVEYFRHRPDSVIVAIMGDHLPPLSSAAFANFSRRLARLPRPEQQRAARAVPLLVWANFALPPGELTLSANMLPGYLLERMGVPRGVLLAATDSVRRTLPVVTAVMQDSAGQVWADDSIPATLVSRLADYRLLQYDLLLGKGYAAISPATAGSR